MKALRLLPLCACWLLLLPSTPLAAQNIDFGKSYINITKGLNGGTIETGDTLEIRAAFVVRSGTYDSCGYSDLVPAGTAFIPGTIRVLTNEGKIYKQFTDAAGDDEGWIAGSAIRINLGFSQAAAPARWFRRGRVANNHRPSFYGSTCIMLASFRIRVTAPIGSVISTGGGSMTYRSGTNPLQTFTFPANTVAVYTNSGICSNAIGTNALGTEFNGTFGGGRPRNRGTSANVPPSYTYATFAASAPQDYYYGIANNTSINTGYTTLNTWPKPDNARRVFGVWDIIGDHTGAASPTAGNPAADTVANGNAGYMLVINASYRIDSAFQQTISNLCPNTYYEISCWMRNICSRCGCDSAGRGAGSAGYLPTAPGDSSGVYPNITFEVDGVDYYTTGNLLYTGRWVKKGFTFRTGPNQTSFTIKFFNNAPGGGGNDWALDDISVATCGPNLSFTPNNQPTVCAGNTVDLGCYVRSYFNNYNLFKWQKSTNNGATWTDAGTSGTGSPTWNGSAWEYYTTLPTFLASQSDSGTRFRVVVATTTANLSNPGCAFADQSSVLTLNVIDCGVPLSTRLLSFSGRSANGSNELSWTTSREEGPLRFLVERSMDGRAFSVVDSVWGRNASGELNSYSWQEPAMPAAYRLRMLNGSKVELSRVVRLGTGTATSQLQTVTSPFRDQLIANLSVGAPQAVTLQLVSMTGAVVRSQQTVAAAGNNVLRILNTTALPAGIYTLRVSLADGVLVRKVVKE
jgi:hypothetical protein